MAQNFPYKGQLLVAGLQQIAQDQPDRIFAVATRTNDLQDGFVDYTFGQVVKMVGCLVMFLKKNLGAKPRHKFETLAYLGVSDLRYSLVQYAAIVCGYKVYYPSPRNPPTTNRFLMGQLQCKTVLFSEELRSFVPDLSKEIPYFKAIAIPSLQELLAFEAEPFRYEVTLQEGLSHPVAVIQSSGSTGTPKPVVITNAAIAVCGADRAMRSIPGRIRMDMTSYDFGGQGGRFFSPFPMFHVAGFVLNTAAPIYTLSISVSGPPLRLPDGDLVLEIMKQQDIKGAALPPSIAEDLFHEPEGRRLLEKLDFLVTAGGPLSKSVGDGLTRLTNLAQLYGSTEVFRLRGLLPSPEDWEYLEFHPDELHRFELSDDDAYELIVMSDPQVNETHPGRFTITHTLPGVKEYRTKDLFRPHPTKPSLWKFHGRRDDILVLATGEKFNPTDMESVLSSDPAVDGALVAGTGRFRPALLIEPHHQYRDTKGVEDRIWRLVDAANSLGVGPGRIAKNMIVFTSPEKPFVRASKGTIIRRLTTDLYSGEVAALYEDNSPAGDFTSAALNKLHVTDLREEEIADVLTEIVRSLLPNTDVQNTDNLYAVGLDSLKTAEAVNSLISRVSQSSWVTSKLFYHHPCIAELARIISARCRGESIQEHNPVEEMKAMVAKYSQFSVAPTDNPGFRLGRQPLTNMKRRIAITGTTGSLGLSLLIYLDRILKKSQIYCLNRNPNAKEIWFNRHASITDFTTPDDAAVGQEREEEENIRATDSTNKVTFWTTTSGASQLGLSTGQVEVLTNCDTVIHSAWKVDFNQPLSSFEENVSSLRCLVDVLVSPASPSSSTIPIASSSSSQLETGPRLIYISSISSTARLARVPESIVTDLNACLPMGYAQSKLVSEIILSQAASVLGLPTTILRVGQIAGPAGFHPPGQIVGSEYRRVHPPSDDENDQWAARWTTRDAIPAMIKTSRTIGMVPEDLRLVNWIPMDVLCHVISGFLVTVPTPVTDGSDSTSHTTAHSTSNGQEREKANDLDTHPQDITTSAGEGEERIESMSGNAIGSEHTSNREEHLKVYNIVNPYETAWTDLLPAIEEYCSHRGSVQDELETEATTLSERSDTVTPSSTSTPDASAPIASPAIQRVTLREWITHLQTVHQSQLTSGLRSRAETPSHVQNLQKDIDRDQTRTQHHVSTLDVEGDDDELPALKTIDFWEYLASSIEQQKAGGGSSPRLVSPQSSHHLRQKQKEQKRKQDGRDMSQTLDSTGPHGEDRNRHEDQSGDGGGDESEEAKHDEKHDKDENEDRTSKRSDSQYDTSLGMARSVIGPITVQMMRRWLSQL